MEVVDGQLFATYVGLASNAARRMLEELAHQPDRNKFISSPTTVNAFYSPVLNSISNSVRTMCTLNNSTSPFCFSFPSGAPPPSVLRPRIGVSENHFDSCRHQFAGAR